MKQKILRGKITAAPRESWYEKDIGKVVEIVPFTHNYYLKKDTCNLCYRVKDIKLIDLCTSTGIPGTPCDADNCNQGCIQQEDLEERKPSRKI